MLDDSVFALSQVVNDINRPISERFNCLLRLGSFPGDDTIKELSRLFSDKSTLLKHECAYVLGQTQNPTAIPILIQNLNDENQDVITRHECGEALGAIGVSTPQVMSALRKQSISNFVELSETCTLALEKLEFVSNGGSKGPSDLYYLSIDPAYPFDESLSLEELKNILLDDTETLYRRYQAIFSLRNINSNESVQILNLGLKCGSSLFRHEVAYVLGQLQNDLSFDALKDASECETEAPMVRHEAVEALSSIGGTRALNVFRGILNKSDSTDQIVIESCLVGCSM